MTYNEIIRQIKDLRTGWNYRIEDDDPKNKSYHEGQVDAADIILWAIKKRKKN